MKGVAHKYDTIAYHNENHGDKISLIGCTAKTQIVNRTHVVNCNGRFMNLDDHICFLKCVSANHHLHFNIIYTMGSKEHNSHFQYLVPTHRIIYQEICVLMSVLCNKPTSILSCRNTTESILNSFIQRWQHYSLVPYCDNSMENILDV